MQSNPSNGHTLLNFSRAVAYHNATPFKEFPYEHRLCNALQDCMNGKLPDGKKNLLITIPPRHYKTTFTSQNFVAWCLGMMPDCEFILTSYSAELAISNCMTVKRIINQPWHKEIYPHLAIAKDEKDTQRYFRTTQGGAVYAVGMEGSITGFGAGKSRKGFGGAIIIDDPMKAADARSDTMRQNAVHYYLSTLKSRRNSADNTPIILIMQRLHTEDLAGWILKNEPDQWHSVVFPAVDDAGNLLNPLTTTKHELETLRVVDPVTYHAQYQQNPIIPGGNMIKLDWWRLYDPAKETPHGLRFITADTGFKEKDNNDQSVLQCWEGTEQGLYFIDSMYGRWDFPKLLHNAQFFYERCGRPREFWIEDKASGTPLEQMMSDSGLPAFAWKPSDFSFPDDKVGRMQAASWFVHGGKVFLPIGNVPVTVGDGQVVHVSPCAAALMEETAGFSRDMSHAHDDHCDAFTMAVSLYKDAGGQAQ